ncbi:MAG: hypothetical protein HWN67_00905 [Candidatus Helarchaeota archaeon]|nr:hypothetical protein [Candidatus Helarchaeota archaeon]
MSYGLYTYIEQLGKISRKSRIASIIMTIAICLSIICLSLLPWGLRNIIRKNGRSPFQILIILGLIINIAANFILWCGATFEDTTLIESNTLINIGFIFGVASWPLMIISTTYGLFWIQTLQFKVEYLLLFIYSSELGLFLAQMFLILDLFDPKTLGILFLWSYEFIYIILIILGLLALIILKTEILEPSEYKFQFRLCPNCKKLIAGPSNFCVNCGEKIKFREND